MKALAALAALARAMAAGSRRLALAAGAGVG
jgi:hypothetical protein